MDILYIIIGIYVIYYTFNILYDLSQNNKAKFASQTSQTIDVKKYAETNNSTVDLSNGTSEEEYIEEEVEESTDEEVEEGTDEEVEEGTEEKKKINTEEDQAEEKTYEIHIVDGLEFYTLPIEFKSEELTNTINTTKIMENFEDDLGMFGIAFIDEFGNEIEKFQPDNLAVVNNYNLYG